MTQPTFTSPPPVPDRGQPDDFNQKMNAFLAYFPTIRNEMAAAIPWLASVVTEVSKSDNSAQALLTKLKTVDGSGSGVDADLLDGQEGAFYRSASNLNAGTVPAGRLPLSVESVAQTGNDTNSLMSPALTSAAISYRASRLVASAHFTVSGTTVTLQRGINVSGVTRLGVGHYRVYFTRGLNDFITYAIAQMDNSAVYGGNLNTLTTHVTDFNGPTIDLRGVNVKESKQIEATSGTLLIMRAGVHKAEHP